MSARRKEFMHKREWGDSKLVGDDNEEFFEKSLEEKAQALAYSSAYSEANTLQPLSGLHVEKTKAFGRLNFWSTYLEEELQRTAPQIYTELQQAIPQEEDEAATTDQSIQYLYSHVLADMFVLFLRQQNADLQESESQQKEAQAKKVVAAVEAFSEIAAQATSLDNLYVQLATTFAEIDTAKEKTWYLYRLFQTAKQSEDTAHSEYNGIYRELMLQGGPLWEAYQQLTPTEFRVIGIGDVDVVSETGELSEAGKDLVEKHVAQSEYSMDDFLEMYAAMEEDADVETICAIIYEYGELNCEETDPFIMRVAIGIEQFAAMYGLL